MSEKRKFFNKYKLCFVFILFLFVLPLSSKKAAAEEEDSESTFFHWETQASEEQKNDTAKNYIYSMYADYEEQTETTGLVHIYIKGTMTYLLKQTSVTRDGKEIYITLLSAVYLLNEREYTEWQDMLSTLGVTDKEDGTVVIKITADTQSEYTYEAEDNLVKLTVSYHIVPDDLKDYGLNILKPQGLSIASVTNEDFYEKKKFEILIKGNHTAFFKEHPIKVNSKKIKRVSIKKRNGKTVITVKTSTLQGYRIIEDGDYFLVETGTPRQIYSSILVLDAGHGGKDNGARAHGMKEKRLNYKILYSLMKPYFSDNDPDIKVYWTRTGDKFISLARRAAFAKKIGADAFISLHMNSAPRKTANGTEVYFCKSNNKKRFDRITSKKMAKLFKNKLVHGLHTHSRGVRSANFYVIKYNSVPAVLIELAFISGSRDDKRLKRNSFQKRAAKTIYNGIVKLFSDYDTGR